MSLLKKANAYFKRGEYVQAYQIYLQLKKNSEFPFVDFNIELCKKKLNPSELNKINNELIKKSKKNECILRMENTSRGIISGWAIDKSNPDNTVILETFIDGNPYSIIETSSERKDVQKAHGGDGFSGFRGEVSKYLTFTGDSLLSITPVSHQVEKNSLKHTSKQIQFLLKGQHFNDANLKAEKLVKKYLTNFISKENTASLKVSVIILNLNGSKVLYECLTSLSKWSKNIEIIVVDHASTDDSINMIKSLNNDNIIIIERDKNYSYSESNNLGAERASGDILLFLNNDIVITSDSVSYMAQVITETEFGLLGIKLWDLPKSKNFTLDPDIKVNQHLGVHFSSTNSNETIEAFELRNSAFVNLDQGILETPAVTAAMMAIKKTDFVELNGFDEDYFYGQEDVDFCLRYQKKFDKKIGVVLEHGAYHIRGLSRKGLSKINTSYINNNRTILQSKLGKDFRRKFRQEIITKPGYWNHKPISIAMIVSEVSFETSKADFFTAKELGDVFDEDENCTVGYFDASTDYDMSGYDIIIVYIDGFNPEKLKNISPNCQVIAWARNWFDRWCERSWIEMYDIIYASSEYAKKYMQKKLKREVKLLRIAASTKCINTVSKDTSYKSDYVFTGSYFNSPREITDALKPRLIPFDFKLYGYNWEAHEKFKDYTLGPVSYKDIPSVYASTKLVVDDANIATKKWGALNCRIYDALASGTACITNNSIGVEELFDNDFPLYVGDDVNTEITKLLSDDMHRDKISAKYQKIVLEKHTYYNRKKTIINDVINNLKKEAISIKIAAPDFFRAVNWGDYYFAIEVRKELELLGYKVRIDCLNDWNGTRSLGDDINIVLRGLNNFKTRNDQVNILWIISHPDLVSEGELKKYDHIFVASEKYTNKLNVFLENSCVQYLPQASAFKISDLDPVILKDTPRHNILFIGNSRGEYREVVKWCIAKKLPISVYGNGWENLIPKEYIKGTFVENRLIPYYYYNAKIVLNDHWDDMKKNGFISNRVYDVLAVGGVLFSDYVIGMEKIKSENLYFYKNKKEFYNIIENRLENNRIYSVDDIDGLSFKERIQEIHQILEVKCK